MNAPAFASRDALAEALRLQPLGEPAGNVTAARGTLEGRVVHAALVENRTASGAIGVAEAEKLSALFRVAALQRSPLVLFLDSAGAKVSEGLAALGGFRHLYRAGLDAVFAGSPVAAVLGRNCFGGSSMLAFLARRRLFAPQSRLGMSGPAVIAAASGMNVLDEAFQAMAEAAMSPAARAGASPLNTEWTPQLDLAEWLRTTLEPREEPIAIASAKRHEGLAARIPGTGAARPWDSVRRADLERIYPEGCALEENGGLLRGIGRDAKGEAQLVGLVGRQPLRAQRAWEFSDLVWRHVERPPARLEVLLDCASHAPSLEDERAVQSEYVVDMAFALATLARAGTQVGLTVLGQAGGGVYVALAAPAARVSAVHGADIQVLPGAAVAAILGSSREALPSFDNYRAARVADEELKLGLAP
ncbi:MAG TPA: carboxyl transferase domain-containing protein [Usitatibacter sp.]|nr:carboxyl transferase domain-containing protein [Usitatibacter sp.]